ncbi:MAG: hypothetical protein ISR64_09405 [Deltaproteobacteria bacterium]|nr:hypothetical protein [Deltaproteobacteria bacterium]
MAIGPLSKTPPEQTLTRPGPNSILSVVEHNPLPVPRRRSGDFALSPAVPGFLALALVAGCAGNQGPADPAPPAYDAVVIGAKDDGNEGPATAADDGAKDPNGGTLDPGSSGCNDSSDCLKAVPICKLPERVCVQCIVSLDCKDDLTCVDNACVTQVCAPDSTSCVGDLLETCSGDGTGKTVHDCSEQGLPCLDGACGGCEPGTLSCLDNVSRTCSDDGTFYIEEDCQDKFCDNGLCLACQPLQKGCVGNDVVECNEDGTVATVVETCDPTENGLVCKNSTCVSLCEVAGEERTNAGCEYWPLDLDQTSENDAENSQFAVIVSNTSGQYDAKVRVFKGADIEKEVIVPKNDLSIILLDPYNISLPGVADLGRRLKSTVPIVAYQFSPLDNVGMYSNDASLLLPTNVLGKVYRVMAWKQRDASLRSYFTLVAVEEGETQVQITATAPVEAGPGLPAIGTGGMGTVALQQFQTLHVKSNENCSDLTGTLIEASKKIAVMGGHECANIPAGANCGGEFCCCDHLEDQLFPVEAWGKHYLLGRSLERHDAPDTVRVLAAENGTQVTIKGEAVTIPVLQAGQFHEFQVDGHVELSSDKPFLAAQYLESQTSPTGCSMDCDDTLLFGKKCDGNFLNQSCNDDQDCCPGVAGIGDPAFIVAVPTEQFRQDYLFLVPNKYELDFVNIIAPGGAAVTLDDTLLGPADFTPIAAGPYSVARTVVADGVHRISSSQKIGIMVYGWDQYVSYGYAGGMNVESLNN